MSGKTKTSAKRKAPAKRATAGKPKAAEAPKIDRRARKTVVGLIRRKVEEKLEKKVDKASLAEYIRLVQLEQELQRTGAEEKNATWVDPRKPEEINERKDLELLK